MWMGRCIRVGGEREQLGKLMAQELQIALAEGEASRTSSCTTELSLQVSGNYQGGFAHRMALVGSLR